MSKDKVFARQKSDTEEKQTLILSEAEAKQEEQQPDKFDLLQKQISDLADVNRNLVEQQVELQKRIEAYEAQKEQERRQMISSKDGKGVEIPDYMKVDVAAARVSIVKPIPPSKPNMKTRYASERSIDRRIAEGWNIHPGLGDPSSGVKQIRDLIPIEISKDNPDYINRRLAKEYREKAHEQELHSMNARGEHYDPNAGTMRQTTYKVEKEFQRTK